MFTCHAEGSFVQGEKAEKSTCTVTIVAATSASHAAKTRPLRNTRYSVDACGTGDTISRLRAGDGTGTHACS